MSKLRIIHITGVRELGSGQRKQLEYERKSAHSITGVKWDTLAIHSGEILNDFEINTPRIFDFLFVRNIFFWILVIKKSRKYDLVLFRHITFDPFVFIFAPLINNRISVHHSKEVEELKLIRKGWKGNCSSFLERYSGRFSLKRVLCIASVTNEVSIYENIRVDLIKETLIYPNGIDIDHIVEADDNRIDDVINIFFMCSYFTSWHGLDILLNDLNSLSSPQKFNIHLVGNLSEQQINDIRNNKYSSNIKCYGNLDSTEYLNVLSHCDVGLGSLAMHRQGLEEGSTLKVREMLAMGIPVYSGHKDAALNENFEYYYYDKSFDFIRLINYGRKNKLVSRAKVRNSSRKYINKTSIMENFIHSLLKMKFLSM